MQIRKHNVNVISLEINIPNNSLILFSLGELHTILIVMIMMLAA